MKRLFYIGSGVIALLAILSLMPNFVSDGAMPVRVSVSVVDKISGKPIQDAQVILKTERANQNPEWFVPIERAVSTTDIDGQTSVSEHFPAGWDKFGGGIRFSGATIEVTAPGYKSTVLPVSKDPTVRWKIFRPRIAVQFEMEKK
jgi:hypothetical protein